MTQDLQGRVAVVTGGASGIGFASASRLAAAGAAVVIADVNVEAGNEALARLGLDGTRAGFEPCDVSVEADVARLVARAVERFGRIDVMFNNAGLGGAIGLLTETSAEDWQRTFHVLLDGVFYGTKHAARQMIAAGQGGAIVNTASVAGMAGGIGPHAYSAAKAAVISLTRTSAVELAAHHIRVNAICPGAVYTPLMHGGDYEDADRTIATVQPWPERGLPEHLAEVVHFLSTPASVFVTGQTITADGGMLAAGPRFVEAQKRGRRTSGVAGFTQGSTGRPNEIRRLERPDGGKSQR